MRHRFLGFVVAVAVAGCGKGDVCERWVKITQKCANPPPTDPVMDAKLSMSVCHGAEKGDPEKEQIERDIKKRKLSLNEVMRKNHQCAVKHDDCAQFAVCLEGVQAEKVGAPPEKAAEAVTVFLEIVGAVTSAVEKSKDCAEQEKIARDTLGQLSAKTGRLRELFVDKTVEHVVAGRSSDRVTAAMAAFDKATVCTSPKVALVEAVGN